MKADTLAGAFVFEPLRTPPVGSVLYAEHLELTDKSHIAEFAGYLMPLWYSSISAEHAAVRRRAGLFDCTHMGVVEISGGGAGEFLDTVTTNQIANLGTGSARYSYILDAAGNVLDDIIIYRRGEDNFMVVVNAANEPKIKGYLASLLAGRAILDVDKPGRQLPYKPGIRDMRDTSADGDCRVDIALQGPKSADILFELCRDENVKKRIESLQSFHFIEAEIGTVDCIISRTGYTGAKTGFELFVHPDSAARLWRRLLEAGEKFGAVPCGLGARDSLRIEAGLPLYGHELAGPFNISPFEAGYGWAVKLDKEFFIGRAPLQRRISDSNMEVARLELPGAKGIRPVRPNDGVLNANGRCIGWVLSCAKAGENQIALVFADEQQVGEGNSVGIYYLARSRSQKDKGKKEGVRPGEKLEADIAGRIVSRFEKF